MHSQTLVLRSRRHFGAHAPAAAVGSVIAAVPALLRGCLRMVWEGRSTAPGPVPAWLDAASNVEFRSYRGTDETVLEFGAVELREVAPRLDWRDVLWDARPAPNDTAFDVLFDALSDVQRTNRASNRFDAALLNSIGEFNSASEGAFDEIVLGAPPRRSPGEVAMNRRVAESAREMQRETPPSRKVRITGRLEAVSEMAQSLVVTLDDDTAIHCNARPEVRSLSAWRGDRVMVIGLAHYRPSGAILRLEAEIVEPTLERAFSQLSSVRSMSRSGVAELERHRDIAGNGRDADFSSLFGAWPGDESDEQLNRALREIG